MTDKELRILDEMLTNLEIWSTWNKTFSNGMLGICSKMRSLLADHKTEPQALKCFNADKYKSCEYVGRCDNHICLKALSEGEKRAKDEPQTERSE